MNKVHFTSNSNEYETPQDLFDLLDSVFHFDLDPAATDENAKCKNYFTAEDDGLVQPWYGNVFLNPPYGGHLRKWIKKAHEEYIKRDLTIVVLMPARTDTKYIHEYVFGTATAICFIRGRLKFVNRTFPSYSEDGNFKLTSAPFPSMIVVYGEPLCQNQVDALSLIGYVIELE